MKRIALVFALVFSPVAGHAANTAALKIHVARAGYRGTLNLSVGLMEAGQRPPVWIFRGKLHRAESQASIRHLAAGKYVVLLGGHEPLEILGEEVVLERAKTRRVGFSLPSGSVEGRVTLGGEPLIGAELTLQKRGTTWRSLVPTDSMGRFRSRSWVAGTVQVSIHSDQLASSVTRRLELQPNSTVDIDLPDRTISGRATDSAGKALSNVNVFLTSQFEDYTTSMRVTTNDDGGFSFAAVFPGTHIVTATAANYLDSGEYPVEIEENARQARVDVQLRPSVARVLDVVDWDGSPVPGSSMSCVADDVLVSRAVTDQSGRATISTPASGRWIVYAFGPRSFAIVPGDRDHPPSRIRLPRANARVTLHTTSSDGKPLSAVAFLIRFDGELIPHAVMEEAERHSLFAFRTSPDGQLRWTAVPVGTYEFWPYQSLQEADEIARTISFGEAPISLRAAAGDNEVTVTFRPRSR